MSERPEGGANLSQREIDMLLASLHEAQLDDVAPAVGQPAALDIYRPYYLRYPDKFSRDQLRTVQSIHDTYGRLVGNALAAQTRANVVIQFSSIDQMPFGEYLQSLESPSCIFVVSGDPLPGHYVIQLSFTVAMHILDRLQGGSGLRPRIPSAGSVTDIERALILAVGRWLVAEFGQAWQEISPFNATEGELVFLPHQVRQILASEVSLAIVYEIRVFDQIGQLSVAIPGSMLEPVMNRLSASMFFAASGPRPRRVQRDRSEIEGPLGDVTLPVAVNLGRATLTMADVADLRVGDVIVTDQDVHSPLEMAVAGETLFDVRPGRIGGRMAAQIVRVVARVGHAAPV